MKGRKRQMQQEQSKTYLGSNVSHGTAHPVIPVQTTCANTGESKISLPETDDSREHEICDLRLSKLPQENDLCEKCSPIISESIDSTSSAISGAEEARLSSLLDMFTAEVRQSAQQTKYKADQAVRE